MDLEDQFMDNDTYLSSELEFDFLSDLDLKLDSELFDHHLLLGEDSNSNSGGSQVSSSDLGYHDTPSSSSDSPPLSPPSPSVSDYGLISTQRITIPHLSTSSSSLVSLPTSILIDTPNLLSVNNIPKSTRGRSASSDSPDVQAMKRHIRMIRNRESACLSRKKKKDYLQSLEARIKELEGENFKLKQENSALKARLGDSNPSTTVIRAFPVPRSKLTDPPAILVPRSRKSTPVARNVAKIALLGLCCFMFVCYRSPSENSTSRNTFNSSIPLSKSMLDPTFGNLVEDDSYHAKLSRRGVRTRRYVNVTQEYQNNNGRTRVRVKDGHDYNESTNRSPFSTQDRTTYRNLTFTKTKKCPLDFNQTEAIRVQNDLKGIFGRKVYQKKQHLPVKKPIVYSLMDLEFNKSKQEDHNKGLTVYDEKMRKYSGVLDKLQQREDTFYVVSLAVDNQLLLSAKAINDSSRPKMSFLMPWKNDSLGGKEELMQIDCEVTGVFNLNSRSKKRSTA